MEKIITRQIVNTENDTLVKIIHGTENFINEKLIETIKETGITTLVLEKVEVNNRW